MTGRWDGALGGGYGRISDDPEDLKHGTGRQEVDILAKAQSLGVTLIEDPLTGKQVFVDDDISASRFARKKVRPGYSRLLEAIEDHSLRVIVVYHVDRFLRRNDELEDLFKLTDRLPYEPWLLTPTMEFNLCNDEHRTLLRIMVSMSGGESAAISRRVKRERVDQRAAGYAGPGCIYGWTGDGRQTIAEQVVVIEQMVEEFLAGEAVASIARRLNAEGVPGRKGGKWTTTTVRNVITHGRHYGVLTWRHPAEHGKPAWLEVLGDAAHPGFIKREKYEQVLATLQGRQRARRPPRMTMLTELVHCPCGAALTRNAERVKRPDRRPVPGRTQSRAVLTCRRTPTIAACGSTSIDAGVVERVVKQAVFERVDNLTLAALARGKRNQTSAASLTTRLAELDEEENENVAAFRAKKRPKSAYLTFERQIDEERTDINRRLAALSTDRLLRPYVGPGKRGSLERDWDRLSVTVQRAIVAEVLRLGAMRIVVGPHTGRRNMPDPTRVRLVKST